VVLGEVGLDDVGELLDELDGGAMNCQTTRLICWPGG
jgi:hypothetical protein